MIRPDGKAVAGMLKDVLITQVEHSLCAKPQFAYLAGRDIGDCLNRINSCIERALRNIQATRQTRFDRRAQVEAGSYNPKAASPLDGCIVLSIDNFQGV